MQGVSTLSLSLRSLLLQCSAPASGGFEAVQCFNGAYVLASKKLVNATQLKPRPVILLSTVKPRPVIVYNHRTCKLLSTIVHVTIGCLVFRSNQLVVLMLGAAVRSQQLSCLSETTACSCTEHISNVVLHGLLTEAWVLL